MGRAPCCDKDNVKRGPWSPEEDAKLKSYIEKHGTGGNWIALPPKIGLKRCGKSCRLRWLNYLRPNIKHGGFSEEEDDIICRLYISIGSRWSVIAAQLPGRTDNDVKNYWNTRLKKKLFPGGNGRLHGKDQNHGRRRPVASADKENQQKLGKERNFTPAAEDGSWKASVQSQLQALLHNRELATVITGNPSAGQFPDTGDSAGQLFGETPPQPTCHGSQLDDLIPLSSLGDRHRGSISTPQGGEALQGADASCMMPELAEMFIFNTANLEGLGGFYGLDYHTEPIGESSRTTTSSQSLSWEETMSQASGLSISDIRFPVFAGGAAGEEQCSPASYINLSTARMELM